MSRAKVSVEPGRIDAAHVMPMAHEDSVLLLVKGDTADVLIEMVNADDLYKIECAIHTYFERAEAERARMAIEVGA